MRNNEQQNEIIRVIHQNWKKSWMKYLFAFTNLAKILDVPNVPNTTIFLKTLINSWAITRYFFQYFIDSKQQKTINTSIENFTLIRNILIKQELFNEDYAEKILENIYNIEIIDQIIDLNKKNRLNHSSMERLFGHPNSNIKSSFNLKIEMQVMNRSDSPNTPSTVSSAVQRLFDYETSVSSSECSTRAVSPY